MLKAAVIVSILAVLAYADAVNTDPINTKKHEIIAKESLLAADAIRKIDISTPEAKLRLENIANDFAFVLHNNDYLLGIGVSNAHDKLTRSAFTVAHEFTNDKAYEIQSLVGKPEQLKEKLSAAIEQLGPAIKKGDETHNGAVYNNLEINLASKEHNYLLYGLHKTKLRSLLFTKNSTELVADLDVSFNALNETLHSITFKPAVEHELRQLVLQLSLNIERCILKTIIWIDVNPDSPRKTDVEEIGRKLTELHRKNCLAVIGSHDTSETSKHLLSVVGTLVDLGKEASHFDYQNYPGSEEFVRSMLFDVIAVGRMYAQNLKEVSTIS